VDNILTGTKRKLKATNITGREALVRRVLLNSFISCIHRCLYWCKGKTALRNMSQNSVCWVYET